MKRALRSALIYLAMGLCAALFLIPLAFMVSTSLKPDGELFAETFAWIPDRFAWENYAKAIEVFPFWLYLKNTLIICVFTVFGTVVSSLCASYAFAKLRWRGSGFWFAAMLATMMLPPQVTLLPVFLIFRKLDWIDTFLPLIVPTFFGSAFSIFLLRQFMLTLPKELSDAARLDGCSEWQILWRIVAPLSRPAIVTVGLFAFVWSWTDFMGPLIYLNDAEKFTLAVGLQFFLGRHGEQWNLLMAAAVMVTLPVAVLFFFAQKKFVQGVATTGLRG